MNNITQMTAELAAMCAAEVTALENPAGAPPAAPAAQPAQTTQEITTPNPRSMLNVALDVA
jgi:hypothetical protein